MRCRHYQLTASGNPQHAVLEAQELVNGAERQVWAVLNDIDGAVKYILDGEKQHPNRHDVVKERERVPPQLPQVGGNNYSTSTSGQFPTFGNQPSVSAVRPGMGASLGRPSTSFGQPSAPASSFGQPSSLGPPKLSFGQPASAFGQSAVLGHPGGGSLGQAPNTISNFAQSIKESPFGQVQGGFPLAGATASGTLQTPVSAFTQPTNAFGQNSAPPIPANPFGQQPPFGNPSPNSTAFDKPTLQQPINTFGQPAAPKPNPFALAGSDRHPTAPGQPAGPASSFGPPNSQGNNMGTKGASIPVDAKHDSQGKLTAWKGKSVRYVENDACYQDNDGSWKKIWFPDGPPVFTKALELPDSAYDEKTKESYRYLKEHGVFKDGLMPELPPRREWCNWNF